MKRVIGIASGILILAGVGYYWAQDKAEKEVAEARQQILKFMKEKLGNEFSITYEFKGLDLFTQTVNINNVVLRKVDQPKSGSMSIGKLSISGDMKSLSIKSLEKFKLGVKSETLATIEQLKIHNLNIQSLIDVKDPLEFVKNLQFENLEVQNAVFGYESLDVEEGGKTGQISIGSLSSGTLNGISLKNISLDQKFFRNTDPVTGISDPSLSRISLESVTLDNFAGIDLIASVASARGEEKAQLSKKLVLLAGKAFNVEKFEVNGIKFQEDTDSPVANLGSLAVDLDRDGDLINKLEVLLSGLEVDKSQVADAHVLPSEILETFKETKLKMNSSLSINANYSDSELSAKLSAGFDKLGKLSLESKYGGINKKLIQFVIDNPGSPKIESELSDKILFKSIKAAFSNDGLTEITKNLAKEHMGLTQEQMVQTMSMQLDQAGEMLDSDQKAELKTALKTFIESGQGLEISIRTKDEAGLSTAKLMGAVMSGKIGETLKLEAKGK